MVLLAQAQELDTTYVIDEQGRTIGLIHEKGAIPRIMPVAAPAPVTESAPVASVNGVDSSAYYQDLVKRYTLSGEKKRSAGNGMMVGGSVGFLLGVLMMVHAEESTDRCGNNDYGCNDDEFLEFITGYGVAIAGGIVFGVGIGLKIAGGAKLRRAERYQDALNRYNARKLQTLKLQVEPIINARKGAFGSRLSLNF
jgi:hypothetical protein